MGNKDKPKNSSPAENHGNSSFPKAPNKDEISTNPSNRLSMEKPPNYSLIEREDHLKKNNDIKLVEINEDNIEIVPNIECEKEKNPKKKNKKKQEKLPTSSTPLKDATIPLIASPADPLFPKCNELPVTDNIEIDAQVDGFPPSYLCKREWL